VDKEEDLVLVVWGVEWGVVEGLIAGLDEVFFVGGMFLEKQRVDLPGEWNGDNYCLRQRIYT
jgi:hypothetical protein